MKQSAAPLTISHQRVRTSDALAHRVADVYALAQQSRHVFASPLGPIRAAQRDAWLPRFVFFGPNTTDLSWRLAFFAGFEGSDVRASHALLGLLEFLGRQAEHGYGLNLTFFPIVDVAAAQWGRRSRGLAAQNWKNASAPEIRLLEKDARAAGYHGYVRIETAPGADDFIGVRMQAPRSFTLSPDVELVSTQDFEPYAVRFESGGSNAAQHGPLSIADDLGVQPFELTLRIPASWSDDVYQRAVTSTLSRFILRYRAFQAYGIHL